MGKEPFEKIDVGAAGIGKQGMHELMTAAIMPRPIAWISTIGENGILNLAPFSMFTNVSLRPPIVCLGVGWGRAGREKDTLHNIRLSRDFVVNVVDENLIEPMNITGGEYPPDIDEFHLAKLTPMNSKIVKAPFVKESPINMECILQQVIEFGERPDGGSLIIGEVVWFHIREGVYINERIQMDKLKHIGRLGGKYYCRTIDRFEVDRVKINL